ncbi:hypothetical protein NESM_000579300 [Novymonas esmeraldas]|uniref:TFIIB-type domain-containing protein n=1 Tax=Novymonas esmeraldas TaxID=1808958 RepID=A0AAW0EQH1_9TRYP
MATAADYVGKGCPFCGAVDSIETDEVRGEAACVNCATVVAMGLEENVATRYEKDATHADVDRDNDWDGNGGVGRATARGGGLTRDEAAAAAAGVLRRTATGAAAHGGNLGPFGDAAPYGRTRLHPRMSGQLEALFRLSRRHDEAILRDAVALAKHLVGFRRERGIRVEHQTEVSAACLMLAAERLGHPIPLAEMRVLDGSLKDVESRRQEVVEAANMGAEMAALAAKYVPNLILYYVQLQQLPLIHYERPCLALVEAMRVCERTAAVGAAGLAAAVEAEKAVMAVLLARAEPRLQWPGKPQQPADPNNEPPRATLYTGFASSAHLQPARVEKLMRVAERAVPLIEPEFARLMRTPAFAVTAVVHHTEEVTPASAPANASVDAPHTRKRRRSRSATPPTA